MMAYMLGYEYPWLACGCAALMVHRREIFRSPGVIGSLSFMDKTAQEDFAFNIMGALIDDDQISSGLQQLL